MVDRMTSKVLVGELLGLDDGPWHDWRGPNDDRAPRKLTQGALSQLLRPFGIRPKTIWPPRRTHGDKSSKGYLRADVEAAWHRYCGAGTPAHPSEIITLAGR
jgi:hypothetical protein